MLVLTAALCFSGATWADDSSGVSPNRLSLPKGPGSLGGIGENVEPNLSMGLMSYAVPIALPSGYVGATPSLQLVYNSGSGNSELGIGWSLALPSIERMTSRGLPRYVEDDLFAANGSDELVRQPGSNVYRSRFEGGFVRYTWEHTTSDDGYWVAEYPDGSKGYFGATAEGDVAADARVEGDAGVFRFHLTETVSTLGHRVRYHYVKDGVASLPALIEYAFEGDTARFEVELEYDPNRADQISDGKPGFEVKITQRLALIRVLKRGEQIRSYALLYQEGTGGLSQLQRVQQFGRDNVGPYEVAFQFGYASEACTMASCPAGTLTAMAGPLGIDFRTGTAELVDLNSDALPDVVDTAGGNHQIFLNQLDTDGHRFAAGIASQAGAANLLNKSVQLFDYDGDGFADLVNGETKAVLRNDGSGDWAEPSIVDGLTLPDFATDSELRFFDYDGDKRIDVIRSDGTSTWYYENQGGGAFVLDDQVPGLGLGFTQDALQLADMNGDGLQDVVQMSPGALSYRMHLGYGRFSDSVAMDNVPNAPSAELKLWDLNGDGLSDAVHLVGSSLQYWLNENGGAFAAQGTVLDSADYDFPDGTDVSTRFADMNGNGSTDVVFIDPSGQVSFLDLFPERPNLLRRIENGIGRVVEVSYGSSAAHLARDGGAESWSHRVPHAMLTVDSIVTWDTLSEIRQEQRFLYHDGYYDGEESQFRGFMTVEVLTAGDENVEEGRALHRFDVGVEDRYRKGLPTEQTTWSNGRELNVVENSYDDCAVGGVEETEPPVRFICQTVARRIVKEGRPEADWVTVEEETSYDGYGNTIEETKHGVTAVGAEACGPCDRAADTFGAPCGPQCLGDESFTLTDYIQPEDNADRWLLRLPTRKRRGGTEDRSAYTDGRFYYDGEPFEGLAEGATHGLLMRSEAKVSANDDRFIPVQRFEYDDTGAVITSRDANGNERSYGYDEASLLLLSETAWLDEGPEHSHGLRMRVEYDPLFDTVTRSSPWLLIVGGEVSGEPEWTEYRYDDFARLEILAKPGDTLQEPTESYHYELAAPISRIVQEKRSRSGEAPDLVTVQCFDGLGRALQTRTKIDGQNFQVSGFVEHHAQGAVFRTHQPYVAEGDQCDEAPTSPLFTESWFDATGRALETVLPDAELYDDTASRTRTEYLPLATRVLDEEDTDSSSDHYDTPTLMHTDGLGRTTAHERFLTPNRSVKVELTYDALSNLKGYRDSEGNEKTQLYDLLGRITRIVDPDSGTTSFVHDDAGNVLEEADGRQVTVVREYDRLNRILREYQEGDEAATEIRHTYDAMDDEAEPCDQCTNLAGKLARITYPAGDDSMGYDERDRAVYLRRRIDDHTFELGTQYDNADRTVGASYPAGLSVQYDLDGAGRVRAIPDFVSEVSYESRGLVRGATLANGVTTTYEHDVLMRLASLEVTLPEDEALLQYAYTRDRVGNILTIAEATATTGVPSANATHRYDAWYRLLSSQLDQGDEEREALTFDYDDLDNIVSKLSSLGSDSVDHVGDYTYGEHGAGPHAVTSAGNISLTYDPAGNALTRSEGDQEDSYTWDFLGRMTHAERGNATVGEYSYGSTRDRVKKVEDGHTTYYVSPNFEVRDGIATLYVMLDDRRVAKVEAPAFSATLLPDLAPGEAESEEFTSDPDGVIAASDAWIAQASVEGVFDVSPPANEDQVSELLATSARRLVTGEERRVTYLHQDHLGTNIATTSDTDQVLQRTEYYPYGQPRYTSQGFTEEHGYTGKERDDATGLTYFGARYLDAKLARWASADPLVRLVQRSVHSNLLAYTYVSSNPIARIDPTGLEDVQQTRLEIKNIKVNLTGSGLNDVSGSISLAKKKLEVSGSRRDKSLSVKFSPVPAFEEQMGGVKVSASLTPYAEFGLAGTDRGFETSFKFGGHAEIGIAGSLGNKNLSGGAEGSVEGDSSSTWFVGITGKGSGPRGLYLATQHEHYVRTNVGFGFDSGSGKVGSTVESTVFHKGLIRREYASFSPEETSTGAKWATRVTNAVARDGIVAGFVAAFGGGKHK
jgi:RHS repeat-associated protein